MGLRENLESFNRKERFHFIGHLLGNKTFRLDPGVLKYISERVGIRIPEDEYFSAMDYHMDWIYASLCLAAGDIKVPQEIKQHAITATQEDVDFLIAFSDDKNVSHLIMIEAKGDTPFTNKQLKSKARRLEAIFGADGNQWPNVVPHFLICSPKEPEKINGSGLPTFMRDGDRIPWFKLELPNNQFKVTRCEQDGKITQNGLYWKTEKRS